MEYDTIETTGKEGYPLAQKMWLNIFPNPTELQKKYPWFYESKKFPSSLYLLNELGQKDVVLGAIGVVFRLYNSKNDQQNIGLCADFAVVQEHQTLVPALKLVKSLIKGSRDKCDLLLGFPNNKSVKVMYRAGFRVLGVVPRYALVLKSTPYIRKIFLSRFISLITVPTDLLLRFYFKITRCKCFSAYDLTEIFNADESFDKLWVTYSEQNHLYTGKRDRAYLNWRFFTTPIYKNRVFSLKHKSTQRLVGYAVVHINAEAHWHVFDFFTLSDDKILKCLIQKLIATAMKENAASISLEFLGSNKVTQLLHRLRFSKRSSERLAVLCPLKKSNEYQYNLYDVNKWYITSADELG